MTQFVLNNGRTKKGKNVMATIRKRRGKWFVEIRKSGYPKIYRTFFEKTDAKKYAKDIETQMDKNIFEDYS